MMKKNNITNKNNNQSSIGLLILGIILLFIPPTTFIGIILLFIYFGGNSKQDIMEQLNREIEKGKNKEKKDYEVNEDGYVISDEEYKFDDLNNSQPVDKEKIDFSDKGIENYKDKDIEFNDQGPIKYYK